MYILYNTAYRMQALGVCISQSSGVCNAQNAGDSNTKCTKGIRVCTAQSVGVRSACCTKFRGLEYITHKVQESRLSHAQRTGIESK